MIRQDIAYLVVLLIMPNPHGKLALPYLHAGSCLKSLASHQRPAVNLKTSPQEAREKLPTCLTQLS